MGAEVSVEDLQIAAGESGKRDGLPKGHEVVVVDGKDSSTLVSALTQETVADAAGTSQKEDLASATNKEILSASAAPPPTEAGVEDHQAAAGLSKKSTGLEDFFYSDDEDLVAAFDPTAPDSPTTQAALEILENTKDDEADLNKRLAVAQEQLKLCEAKKKAEESAAAESDGNDAAALAFAKKKAAEEKAKQDAVAAAAKKRADEEAAAKKRAHEEKAKQVAAAAAAKKAEEDAVAATNRAVEEAIAKKAAIDAKKKKARQEALAKKKAEQHAAVGALEDAQQQAAEAPAKKSKEAPPSKNNKKEAPAAKNNKQAPAAKKRKEAPAPKKMETSATKKKKKEEAAAKRKATLAKKKAKQMAEEDEMEEIVSRWKAPLRPDQIFSLTLCRRRIAFLFKWLRGTLCQHLFKGTRAAIPTCSVCHQDRFLSLHVCLFVVRLSSLHPKRYEMHGIKLLGRLRLCGSSSHFRFPFVAPCTSHFRQLDETPCDKNHQAISHLIPTDTASYFTEAYLSSTPWWPSKCCGKDCGIKFGTAEYPVGPKKKVYSCENAVKQTHNCTFALCEACYNTLSIQSPLKRSKRKNRRFLD